MAINDIGPPHQITQIDRSGDKLCLVIDDHKKYLRKITRHTFTQKIVCIHQHCGNFFQEIVNLHNHSLFKYLFGSLFYW